MIEESGVRMSWLIFARNSDLSAAALSAWCLAAASSRSAFFDGVMSRRTTQNFSPCGDDPADRHEEMDLAAVPHAPGDLAAVRDRHGRRRG